MSFLQTLFFESPFWLGIFCFLGFAVVLLLRRRWTGNAARYSLPITLAVVVLLFLVQSLVTTQREEIQEATDALVVAVENKTVPAIRRVISPDYSSEGMDSDAIVDSIESILQSVTVRGTQIARLDVIVEGDQAHMILGARATVSIRGAIGEFHTGRWRVEWRREGDAWKITSLRPEQIDGITIESMHALRSHVP